MRPERAEVFLDFALLTLFKPMEFPYKVLNTYSPLYILSSHRLYIAGNIVNSLYVDRFHHGKQCKT